ncbi:MAG: TIM barrel protein [Gemmatimonadetes bacterium]|nr:TIM barrel protein [Gemmatimonadota bacterium]
MQRRHFVECAAAGGTALAVGGWGSCTRDRAAGSGIAWGIQLYTLRSLMEADVERTLAQVAELGYREVEFAGYFARSPDQIAAVLAAEGLSAPATHLPLEAFRDHLDSTLETASAAGHRYLVLPWMPDEMRGDSDTYRRTGEEMNAWGAKCAQAGMRFGYHNHDFELVLFAAPAADAATPLDVLIQSTDPDLVTFEMDFFWMVHGGADPLDFFARYPGRFELCHVKDRTADGQMVDVGAGTIDFAGILAERGGAGMRHYFVEHDNPADPMNTARGSLDHLASLGIS